MRGAGDAPVTVVEYGDYQCPYCARAHQNVRRLLQRFGDDVRFVFRHFPLTEVHPLALPAAETAEFAGEQGRFWRMHDAIYDSASALSVSHLVALAVELGLEDDRLLQAWMSGTYKPKIQADFMGGVQSGVNGTPCFFINGVRHDGGYEVPDLAAAINAALGGVTRMPDAPGRGATA